jgi:hypothetical protein
MPNQKEDRQEQETLVARRRSVRSRYRSGPGVFVGDLRHRGSRGECAKPVNSSPPTISGTVQEGKTLTATRGTWDNTPTDYNYFWRRCGACGGNCSNISGTHALTYTLRAVDVGKTLRSRVVAKNADGQTTADSAPTDVVQKGTAPPPTTTTPSRVAAVRPEASLLDPRQPPPVTTANEGLLPGSGPSSTAPYPTHGAHNLPN